MKMPYCRATVAAMIVVAGIAFCLPARASSFSVGGSVTATATDEYGTGIYARSKITLGWTNPTDSIYASSYSSQVCVTNGKRLTDGYGGIYEGTIQDPDNDIAGKTLWPGFKDPEGAAINDPAVIKWLAENGFRQTDINRLGHDAAATEKLYERWLLNCDLTAENPGGALSITGFAVSTNHVSVTVQLVRQSPLGHIVGALYLYGADDLAAGFGRSPISKENIDFGDGDPTFKTEASGLVTQTVTATFDTSSVTEKFFKAAIEFQHHEDLEDPGDTSDEEQELEE